MTAQIQESQGFQGFQSLKVSLIIAFLLVSTVILIITDSLNLYFNFTILRQAGSTQQQLIAQEAAGTVESSLQEKFRILETGVNLGNLATASRDQQQLMVDKLLGLEPAFRQVLLLDTNDKELVRISRLSQGASTLFFDQLTSDVLASIHKSKEYIGSVYIDNVNNEPMVVMAVPNTDVMGTYQGALVAEVNLKFMWDLVDTIKVGQGGQAYVVDKKGDLLAYTDISRVLAGENLSKLEGIREFVSGKKALGNFIDISKGIHNTFVVSKYVALNRPNWAVVVELPAEEAYQNVIQLIELLVGVTILGFVFAIISGIILSGRISKPIINLKNTALEISKGNLATRITITSNDEIGQLANAFNQMATQLQQSYGILEQKVKERTGELEEVKKKLETVNLDLEGKIQERTAELEKLKSNLEQQVAQRTEELNRKVSELEQMNKLMTGRELRMAELKKELDKYRSGTNPPTPPPEENKTI